MTGLGAVLAHRQGAGVYRYGEVADPGALRRTVEEAGWRWARLDGGEGDSRGRFLRAVGGALDLPDHYGHNLDALADCLRDLSRDTVLLWDGWAYLARSDEAVFRAACGIFAEQAARAEQRHRAALVVLLGGAGPAVDVPLLG